MSRHEQPSHAILRSSCQPTRKNRWPAAAVSKACLSGRCSYCYTLTCEHGCHGVQ